MTSSATMPIEIVTLAAPLAAPLSSPVKLTPLGDADAAVCEGDFCELPDHHTQAAVNRKLDDDAV
jgi:hypothetical protein